MEKDIIVAILGAGAGLAGILLVFVGFIYSHGETFSTAGVKAKFKLVARLGLIPFAVSLFSSWMCLKWLETPAAPSYSWAVASFRLSLILTCAYGIVALLFYL
jgi:hypothetical protein